MRGADGNSYASPARAIVNTARVTSSIATVSDASRRFCNATTLWVPCYDSRNRLHNQVVKSDRTASFSIDTSADPAIWSFFALQRETESLSTL
jgi:hypothetical protein